MSAKIDDNLSHSNSGDEDVAFFEMQPNLQEENEECAPSTMKQTYPCDSHSSTESNLGIGHHPLESSDETHKIENHLLKPPKVIAIDHHHRATRTSLSSSTSESFKAHVKLPDRAKRKSWYNIIYPTYKARSETFKRLFVDVPATERLIVDYSCALQREILAHGRMYVSQHYLCFHANIFGWETLLSLKWHDVTALTKEKTALVIPNAILVHTRTEKYFIASFAARDKAYLQLFRIWQNALMNRSMVAQEIWQNIHKVYGEQLGLTSDDEEDYIDPFGGEPVTDESTNSKVIEEVTQSEKSKSKDNSESDNQQVNIVDKRDRCDEHSSSICAVNCDINSLAVNQTVAHSSGMKNSMSSLAGKSKMRHNRSKDIDELLTNENIPTDLSDSTDSNDENSVPFVCTAECTSMHEGRQVVHTILPINVDNLFGLLFSKSKFFAEFHAIRKTTNMIYRDWVTGDDGVKTRTLNFTVAVTQAVGPKSSNMTEVQTMRECTVPGQLYSIDITSTNAGIPYADSFQVVFHYCLVRTVDDHTMLSVYAQIKYVKSVWGVVKGFIEKNIWCGLEDFYKALLNALQSEYCIPPAKSKSRRSKRALSQKLSIEDASSRVKFSPTITSSMNPSDATAPSATTKLTSRISKSSSLLMVDQPKSKLHIGLFMEQFAIFIVVLIIALLLLNICLIVKLYLLETTDCTRVPVIATIPSAATGGIQHNGVPIASSDENVRQKWLDLLTQQDGLPDMEMTKWQEFIDATIDLLHKIENIYTSLSLQLNKSLISKPATKDEL